MWGYRCSSPCLLPGAWLRHYSQESRLQVVLEGGIVLSFCCVSSQDSGALLPCKEEEFVFLPGQLCMLKAGGKFNSGYKGLGNAPVWCKTKE